MFNKILIANRGEIACRVMQTAQSMGVRCVAVYSDADAEAKHVVMADEAVHIGGAAPADSYLRGDVIVQAALETGAQGIHPGYGFLSENPDFVESVAAAGLTFIGPSAQAIRAMGLKDAAKALMVEAGVPVVPGYHGSDQSDDLLAREADKMGYPVLIKAVAGGGGKGMRLVEGPEGFADALASARSEAQTAFGNRDVLVEKFVTHPRHIEVQVFGDGTRALHLFERDCSLQRRHQKVVEEAPAPGMTPQMRAAMGDAAVKAAEAIGYKGAGTVEFIVDGSGPLRPDGFFFMEMNTRLQVEHPVTEAITGVDLVEWQLRVAAGEDLPATQDQLSITGHAFEARLYAEDVPAGFLPAIGTLTHLQFPESARADSGVRAGDEISPYYDPMIAKVIVSGPTRAVALNRMLAALQGTEVAGTTTNLGFLQALVAHPDFVSGAMDTGLIARSLAQLTKQAEPRPVDVIAAGMAVTGLGERGATLGFSLWAPLRQHVMLAQQARVLDLAVEVTGRCARLWHLDGTAYQVTWRAGRWWCDGIDLPHTHVDAASVTVFAAPPQCFERIDPLARESAAGQDAAGLVAPMPGLVRTLAARAGQDVPAGTPLLVLEAMKMEHALPAPRDIRVRAVHVSEGDQVAAGDVLVEFEE